jgi:AraC-like DNA-binding protein
MQPSSRGVLYPDRLPVFHRLVPSGAAADVVRWIWISEWDVPPGEVSRQHLIGFPALNLVVEHDMVGVSGPCTRASYRDLVGTGWAVAALLHPAAVSTLTADPRRLRDRYVPMDLPDLHRSIAPLEPTDAGRQRAADILAAWVVSTVGPLSPEALLANRLVELAGSDESLLRVPELADRLGTSERTLQRLAARYVGLTPAALIRRRRLQEAAERLRSEPHTDLATLATELGYADQSHLTNDFARVLGFSPGDYRRTAAG